MFSLHMVELNMILKVSYTIFFYLDLDFIVAVDYKVSIFKFQERAMCVHMCVCVYVCMYACMYVCMYVRMYVCVSFMCCWYFLFSYLM